MLFDLESIWSKSKTHPSHVRPAVLNQITKRPSQPVHNQLTSYLAFLHLKSLVANLCTAFLHPSAVWQALLVFISVTAVRATDAGGQGQCPPFSCGDLHNISFPFRRPGDTPECGVKAYELVCIHGKSTILINTGTYFVTSINYRSLVPGRGCQLGYAQQLPFSSLGSVSILHF